MHLLRHALITVIHSIMELTNPRLDVFKRFKMLLTGIHKFDRIFPILTSLHWLPVKQRIELKIVVFVFKALRGLAPTYLSDLLRYHNPSRGLRSCLCNIFFFAAQNKCDFKCIWKCSHVQKYRMLRMWRIMIMIIVIESESTEDSHPLLLRLTQRLQL